MSAPRLLRAGLTLRVTAVTVAAMILVLVIILGAFLLQNRTQSTRLPVPDRVAAIVQVLEARSLADEAAVLRALDADDLDVRLDHGPWPTPASARSDFPALVFLTKRYLGALGDRRVEASFGDDESGRGWLQMLVGRDSLRTGARLRLRVQLRDGRIAVIDFGGRVLRAPLAGQIAIGAAVMILLTALLSAWSLKHQIRPLEQLVRAVERFGSSTDGEPLPGSGVREVHQLVSAFDAMRERVRRLIEGRTRMLAAISHDLGTYLTRLRLRVDYIADPVQRERAELDLVHVQQLLRDTLMLARLDSGEPRHDESSAVVLAALVRRQLAQWLATDDDGETARPPVTLLPPDAIAEALRVSGRELALARLLDNLVGNALKYAGDAEVSVRRVGDRAELRVDDHGPGIAHAERELVLEPFYRLDRARTLDEQGSGLGLAIVADVVARHRGELRLEERPGGGLRVRVLLPLAD